MNPLPYGHPITQDVYGKLFASVEEYIDDHYVAQNDESYQFDRRRRESTERRRRLPEEDAALPMLGAVPAPAAHPGQPAVWKA